MEFSGIYVGPKSGGAPRSVPLILWPHGGPHSAVPTVFFNEVHYFASMGLAVLFVNYRGSTGAGKDSVDSLPGHVGDLDVKDCHQVSLHCFIFRLAPANEPFS